MQGLIEKAVERVLVGDNGPSPDFGSEHKIVICHRGFVYAGDVTREGAYIVVRNAVNIRRWGTTYGLGELAVGGVKEDTITDLVGVIRVHELAVVAMIDCKERICATTT